MTSPNSASAASGGLATLLIQAAEGAKDEFAAAAHALGLPIPVARAILTMDEPAPMRELADSLSCDRSYITGVADSLESLGLASRVTGDDRRVKLLALTAKGRNARDALRARLTEQSSLLGRLSPAEQEQLAPLLGKLAGFATCPISGREL